MNVFLSFVNVQKIGELATATSYHCSLDILSGLKAGKEYIMVIWQFSRLRPEWVTAAVNKQCCSKCRSESLPFIEPEN